jgi:hypothetical protein
MDCRKARYYLVTSFDEPLDAETRQELSYHLKDCRRCRHEAFFYRELISAKEHAPEPALPGDFNERLIASIRLRDAQASWPKARMAPRRRWQWAAVPALFATSAAAAFFVFRTETIPTSRPLAGADDAVVADVVPLQTREPMAQPKYIYGGILPRPGESEARGAQIPVQATVYDHPFARQIDELTRNRQSSLVASRVREQTRYVLPVVSNDSVYERIY